MMANTALLTPSIRDSKRQNRWRHDRLKQERPGLQLRNKFKRSRRAGPFQFAPPHATLRRIRESAPQSLTKRFQ